MAVLAGKLGAWRDDCAPVAGKSTLNRLELSREAPTKYRKIAINRRRSSACSSTCSSRRTLGRAPDRSRHRRDRSPGLTRDRCTAIRRAASSRYYDCYCYHAAVCVSAAASFGGEAAAVEHRRQRGAVEEIARSSRKSGRWPRGASCARRFRLRARGVDELGENNRVDFLFGLARNARLVERFMSNWPTPRRRRCAPAAGAALQSGHRLNELLLRSSRKIAAVRPPV